VSELLDVLRAMDELSARGEELALATIVETSGSTYRGAGARLLVPAEGPSIGNISGGCLEGDVEDNAREVMAAGESRLLDFDLTADDEAVWGWGLGCNGAIEVLVEPADRAAEIARTLRRAVEEEERLSTVTVLDGSGGVESGARLVVRASGAHEGTLGDEEVDRAAAALARRALADGWTGATELGTSAGEHRVFVETLLPPPRLIVCGAGHDAIPVVDVVARLGWRVLVVDDRRKLLDGQRFPGAAGFVHVDRPFDAAGAVGVDDRTYVVVMTHNYLRDMDYLRSFVGSEVAYLGMLGPRRRLERLFGDLEGQGVEPSVEDLERIHGPAGLDIGADGPAEIATAIAAELVAVHRDRSGGFLRDREGPIHDRTAPGPTPVARG
jgi:xanthine dehydrogenase accessory factor